MIPEDFAVLHSLKPQRAIVVLRLLEIPRVTLKTARASLEHQSLEDFLIQRLYAPSCPSMPPAF